MVVIGGKIVPHGNPIDKVVASRRKIVRTIDATNVLRAFARRVALDVLPLWPEVPKIVKRYLETGDESIRAAARDAARDAAWAAAWAAAWDAARAAAWDAARDEARAAAWAAAWDAARAAAWDAARDAARAAAWAAARDAAIAKYRSWFAEMIDAEFAKQQPITKG
jgi:hypothetical protein